MTDRRKNKPTGVGHEIMNRKAAGESNCLICSAVLGDHSTRRPISPLTQVNAKPREFLQQFVSPRLILPASEKCYVCRTCYKSLETGTNVLERLNGVIGGLSWEGSVVLPMNQSNPATVEEPPAINAGVQTEGENRAMVVDPTSICSSRGLAAVEEQMEEQSGSFDGGGAELWVESHNSSSISTITGLPGPSSATTASAFELSSDSSMPTVTLSLSNISVTATSSPRKRQASAAEHPAAKRPRKDAIGQLFATPPRRCPVTSSPLSQVKVCVWI